MDPATRDRNWMEEDKFQTNGKLAEKKGWISTVTVGSGGKSKLIHYDADRLLRIGALWTIFCKGTVFNKALLVSLMQYVFAFSIGFAILFVKGEGWKYSGGDPQFDKEIIREMERIYSNLRGPTMFIFGLFTSLTIGRWWAVRVLAVGKILDAVVHVTTFLTMAVEKKADLRPEDRDIAEQDIHKVIKLGVASVQCITQISRGDEYMKEAAQAMARDELVTQREAALLSECPDCCVLLWSWISMVGSGVLSHIALPPPNHNPFTASVQDTCLAITRLEAFHNTQLPYPYVHMMVLLVNVHNLLISFKDGMYFCQIYNLMCADLLTCGPTPTTPITTAAPELGTGWILGPVCTGNFAFQTSAVAVLLHLLVVPTFYQGLLHICFLLEDPMGDDITDFPIKAFQMRLFTHCKAILKASHDFWENRTAAEAARRAAAAATSPAATKPEPAPPAPPAPPAAPATMAQLPLEAQRSVEAEIARRFESEMAKHITDLTASTNYLTRRTGAIQNATRPKP